MNNLQISQMETLFGGYSTPTPDGQDKTTKCLAFITMGGITGFYQGTLSGYLALGTLSGMATGAAAGCF